MNGRIAHRVMELIDEKFHCGTKIVPSALTRILKRAESLSDDEYIRIQYLFVAESTFTEYFVNGPRSMERYMGGTMNLIQYMFESLRLRIKVALNGIIKLTKIKRN